MYSPVYAPMYRCNVLSRKFGVVGFPPTNGEHFEPWIWIRFSSSKVGSWYQPWEPTAFIFRGCNPYLGGLKPSFFMVLGSKGSFYFSFGGSGAHPVFLREDFHPSRWEEISFRFESIRTSPGSDKKHPRPHLYLNWWSVTFFFGYKRILTLGASWI